MWSRMVHYGKKGPKQGYKKKLCCLDSICQAICIIVYAKFHTVAISETLNYR